MMNRTFRGKPVERWVVIDKEYKGELETELNKLLDEWEFVDCQYSTHCQQLTTGTKEHFTALVLLAKKGPESHLGFTTIPPHNPFETKR